MVSWLFLKISHRRMCLLLVTPVIHSIKQTLVTYYVCNNLDIFYIRNKINLKFFFSFLIHFLFNTLSFSDTVSSEIICVCVFIGGVFATFSKCIKTKMYATTIFAGSIVGFIICYSAGMEVESKCRHLIII